MTAVLEAQPFVAAAADEPSHSRALRYSCAAARRWRGALIVIVLAAYALLQNGYYVPNSDAEYYISIARNLHLGRGYQYNGEPVGLVPPGWPLLLAGAMWFSNSFALLNWLPALLMVATAGLWFQVLLRLTSPSRAFIAVLLSTTLFWGYHSAILLQSEALFCLLLALGMLLALQIAEGKTAVWRLPVLLLLCAGLVTVRWAGLLAWIVVAAALVSGHVRAARKVQWLGVVLLAATAVASFVGVRYMLKHWGADSTAAVVAEDAAGEAGQPKSRLLEEKIVVPNVDTQRLSRSFYTIVPRGGPLVYVARLAGAGVWMSVLFWMPAKLAVASPGLAMFANGAGWILLSAFAVQLVRATRQRQWLWVGVMLYAGLLVLRWSSANERYLLPVAPFLLLGPWLGLEYLAQLVSGRARPWLLALAAVPIVSVALCNACLFTIDACVARSPQYYAVHHAGRTETLVDAAEYLKGRALADRELAVSPLYININRPVQNSYGVRVMNLLTDRVVLTVPRQVCEGAPDSHLIAWARGKGIRYYLYRPPVSPWRVWHFRTRWLQEKLTGQRVTAVNPFWELYELTEDRAVKLQLPRAGARPRRLAVVER